jgi:hypothetical protein
MDILILIDGEELSRWPVPNINLIGVEDLPWQQRAITKETAVKFYLEWVKMKTQKQVARFKNVSYVLAVESKMNYLSEESITLSLNDQQFEVLYLKGWIDQNGSWIEKNKTITHVK